MNYNTYLIRFLVIFVFFYRYYLQTFTKAYYLQIYSPKHRLYILQAKGSINGENLPFPVVQIYEPFQAI